LHFYSPALNDLDGLKLFALDGTIVELNSKAPSASLHLPKDCYKSYKKNQFAFEDGSKGKSHIISPIIPKPPAKEIKKMIQEYYTEQAHSYDNSDIEDDKRRIYVDGINKIIVKELVRYKPTRVLDIATGTGKRASKIKEMTELDYDLLGVDLNPEMCEEAKKKGIEAFCCDWLDVSIKDDDLDIITMLYSFGHIPTSSERIQFLEKVHLKLKSGGIFYFDVFNINDPYEWGSKALSLFEEYNLDYFGYEKGDVFYRRKGMDKVAFLHYFEEERLVALLESLGFIVESVVHMGYVHKSGEILEGIEGKLLIKALKK
jgi:ubiquinone/menaquinone biosynthesis C-methylase UbiE